MLLAISSQFVVQRGWLPTDVSLFGMPVQIYPVTFLEDFTPWLESNNDHMCCMFTKDGSLIKPLPFTLRIVCMVSFAYTVKSNFQTIITN